jgi:hypothetical protein
MNQALYARMNNKKNEKKNWPAVQVLNKMIAMCVLPDGHKHRWFHFPSNWIVIPEECIACWLYTKTRMHG